MPSRDQQREKRFYERIPVIKIAFSESALFLHQLDLKTLRKGEKYARSTSNAKYILMSFSYFLNNI